MLPLLFYSSFLSLFLPLKPPIITIMVANATHVKYASEICEEMSDSSKKRGTGIAVRTTEYVTKKIEEGKAIVAFTPEGKWAGFCYIESWSDANYVANSGLIVAPEFRGQGLARRIKRAIFKLSREKYPNAKIFGLTTGLAVMRINSELDYQPVTYSELTQDEAFWQGCKSCVNYDILTAKNRKMCICTAMLYDPKKKVKSKKFDGFNVLRDFDLFDRWMKLKQWSLLKLFKK